MQTVAQPMSVADGQHHLRKMVCEGCYRRCRYAKFKVRPGQRGKELYCGVLDELTVDEDNSEKWRYKRRGTVLGYLHDEKMAAWKQMTENCPHQGDVLELGDLVEWTTEKGSQLEGMLVQEVPPGFNGLTVALEVGLEGRYRLHIEPSDSVRDHGTFLVEIDRELRWPYVQRLSLVEDAEDLPF